MPRPKGSKNKPKTDTAVEEKVTRTRKPTVDSLTKKIESLEKQKVEIDNQISAIKEQISEMEKEQAAQSVIEEAMKSMSATELAELIKKAKGE